jgi:hypothetical protein
VSRAKSDAVTKTEPGVYCFKATWAGDTNYPNGASDIGSNGSECFRVRDTSSITTAQKWLPQDTATVTLGSGGTPAGTVQFTLYESADCSGAAVQTFSDNEAPFVTNNETYYTDDKTISWSATFTPSNPNAVEGSTTTRCEKSVLDITNDAGPFPPPAPTP